MAYVVEKAGRHYAVIYTRTCVRVLARRKPEIERRTRATPVGWRFWRRVLFRLGYNRC